MSEITEEEIASIIRSYMDDLRADIYFDIYDKEVAAAGAAATVLALLHPAIERARVEERERCALVAESCGDTWSGSRCVEQAVQEAAADEKVAEIAAAIRKT